MFVYHPRLTLRHQASSRFGEADQSSSSVLPEMCTVVAVDPQRTVAHLKDLIADVMGCTEIPPSMRVRGNGRTLGDGASLTASGLTDGSNVHVLVTLSGGPFNNESSSSSTTDVPPPLPPNEDSPSKRTQK